MNTIKTTGTITASAIITTNRALFAGMLVNTDGINDATVTVYNGQSASGEVLAKLVVTAASNYGFIEFSNLVQAPFGLYIAIAGTGASAVVYNG